MPAANITNGLNVADLSKFEATTTSGILKLIDGEKQYDGSCAKLIDGTGTYAEEDVRTARNAEALNGSWKARLVGWEESTALNYLTCKTRVQGSPHEVEFRAKFGVSRLVFDRILQELRVEHLNWAREANIRSRQARRLRLGRRLRFLRSAPGFRGRRLAPRLRRRVRQ